MPLYPIPFVVGKSAMPLERKLQARGSSIAVVLPAQVLRMMSLKAGDRVEVTTLGRDEIVLRVVR